MTTEDRRLVAALTTEVCEHRRIMLDLVSVIERLCSDSCKRPERISIYVEAKVLLK